MPIDLYYTSLSPPCRVVSTVAKEMGIKLNIKPLDLLKGEHKTKEFLKINPLHKLPTINDNGYILWESHVIITYFCNKYGTKKNEHLYPKDPQKRADVDRILYYNGGTLFDAFAAYIRPRFGFSKDDPAIGDAKVPPVLEFLEKILQKGPYLTGEVYTVGDICCLVYISTLEVVGYDFGPYPKLRKWLETLKSQINGFEETNAEGFLLTKEFLARGSATQ